MTFKASCDTCDLDEVVETESHAYEVALEHEQEHGDHFVLISEIY